ncbi:MAG: O-antigen ligase family protein [Kiritimatiellae bacterium]|nr:O-antigen ligase family protein [Kiritimatiellia bacterium]
MRFVYDNLAVMYLAIVASLLAWMFGGTHSEPLVKVLPWLFLCTAEVVFIFPQKRQDESTYDARERVWFALKKDPLFWVSAALIGLLAIPFANSGLCVSCDRELIALGHSPEPPVKFLPFCVNRMNHLNVFLWFATALPCMLAVKHCLRRSGKRMLLEMIVWNGFALAILGFVQAVAGAEGPLWQPFANVKHATTFFSTFGYPNMAGDYFTTLFGIAVALWRRSNDEVSVELRKGHDSTSLNPYRTFWRRHYRLIPAVVFFFAALNTLSRAAMMLVSLLTVVYFAHTFISFTHRMSRANRLKKGTLALALTGLVVFVASLSIPEDMQREVDTLNTTEVLERVTGKGQYHVRVATEIWKDHILFGCGGWGYKHFCIPKMTPEELKSIQMVGGMNVHNDYLQFLAEHGLVGFGLMVMVVLLLLSPVAAAWKKLVRAARFAKASDLPPKPVQLFAMPAPAFFILLTAVATFVHGFGDCPLRSPAVLTLFLMSLAAVPGFLPKTAKQEDEEDHHAAC